MKYTSTSLYRYAGGKNKMKDEIIKIIDEVHPNLDRMMSPFMGGGCIELALAARGVKVQAYDLFQPLADFWEILTTEGGKKIAEEAAKHCPLKDREHYKSFLPLLESDDKFTRAWSFYHQGRIFVPQV
jgi:site-specific DNA-adenine methylase